MDWQGFSFNHLYVWTVVFVPEASVRLRMNLMLFPQIPGLRSAPLLVRRCGNVQWDTGSKPFLSHVLISVHNIFACIYIYGFPPSGVKSNTPYPSYSVVFRLESVDEHLSRVQFQAQEAGVLRSLFPRSEDRAIGLHSVSTEHCRRPIRLLEQCLQHPRDCLREVRGR